MLVYYYNIIIISIRINIILQLNINDIQYCNPLNRLHFNCLIISLNKKHYIEYIFIFSLSKKLN